jgi:hypothetical protein
MADELKDNSFSIGINMQITRLFPRRLRQKGQKMQKRKNIYSHLYDPICFNISEKKLLIPCPYLDLELLLINTSPQQWSREELLKKYKTAKIIPHNPESVAFEISLPFIIPNPYKKQIDFLTKYIDAELRCRWSFKKLMNLWSYKKYNTRLFNTHDPVTCCEPERPIYLYNAKQRGSYVFEILTLKKHFETALKSNEYLVPTSTRPKNPFTNIPFSLCDQIAIIDSLKMHGQTSWAIEAYKSTGYKILNFVNKFKVALRCEYIDEYINNPQAQESKEHMIDFIGYVFDIYDSELVVTNEKFKLLKWGINKAPNNPFIKIWRNIYRAYYHMLYQNPTVNENDLIYKDIFCKMFANLKKEEEYKLLAEERLFQAATQ